MPCTSCLKVRLDGLQEQVESTRNLHGRAQQAALNAQVQLVQLEAQIALLQQLIAEDEAEQATEVSPIEGQSGDG